GLHRLLRDRDREHRPSGQGDPRPHPRGHEEGARPAAADGRGTAAGAVGPVGLSRRRRPRLHAGHTRVLPPRTAVGGGAGPRGRFVQLTREHSMGRNLASLLTDTAARQGDHPAVKLDDVTLSYAMLDEGSARVATFLFEQGFRPGDRVGIMLPNVPHFPLVYY